MESTIFFDMDGVLADFDGRASEILGGRGFTDEDWGELPDDFFRTLPVLDGARELWDHVNDYTARTYILTSIPRRERGGVAHHAVKGKIDWMYEHFGVTPERIHPVRRLDKAYFATYGIGVGVRNSNILIDDDHENVERFRDHDGIGILHRWRDFRVTVKKFDSWMKFLTYHREDKKY